MQEDYYVIAPLSAISKRTRLYKLARFLSKERRANSITHVGWERISGEREEDQLRDMAIGKEILLTGGGYGGRKVKLMYLAWMVKVFVRCLRLKRSDVIWALGFESAFPAVLASKVKRYRVVFDDADRFSMLFKFPRLIKRVLEHLEAFTSRNSTFHVIPGTARYDFTSRGFFEIKNTPSAGELEKARSIFESREWPAANVVLNVNGWLGAGRGMSTVLTLAKQLENDSFHIVMAGKLDCEAAVELAGRSNVTYLGRVSNAEALAAYYASDFVFTYYDPNDEINQLAESNKWGDAMKVGIGVVVNNEVETARYLVDGGAALSVGYNDSGLLVEIFRQLAASNSSSEYGAAALQLSHRFGFYEEQLKILFEAIDKK